jgi:hypothetical protein
MKVFYSDEDAGYISFPLRNCRRLGVDGQHPRRAERGHGPSHFDDTFGTRGQGCFSLLLP